MTVLIRRPRARPSRQRTACRGPGALTAWIIGSFRPFAGTLAGVEGHRGFRLLEVVHDGPHCCLVSVSTWTGIAAFRAWQASGSFTAAHDAARAGGGNFAMLSRACRYDLPAVTLAELERPLLAMIGADYPDVWTSGAALRAVPGIGSAGDHGEKAAARAAVS